MITIHDGTNHMLETRVVFDDLESLLAANEGDLEKIGGLSHDYLVNDLGISDPKKIGRLAFGLEWQIPCAPMSEMGLFVYKNMFSRGFRAARALREGVEDV